MGISLQDIIGGSIVDGIGKVLSLFKVDPTVALQNQTEILKLQMGMQSQIFSAAQQEAVAQTQVNIAEAQSKSIFVAGWRPFCGWVCGSALAYTFAIQPFLVFILVANGHKDIVSQLPQLELGSLMPVLTGMLGLAGMRTYERVNGVGLGNQ